MSNAPRHLEFAPPPTPGLLRALGLAILAHVVLLAVLSMGVQWKRDAVHETIEAELWASVPVQAAPPPPEPVVAPEPPKPVPPEPKPEPKAEPKPAPPPPDTSKADAEIALLKEKAKAKQLTEKKLALEKAELEKKKLAELEKQKQEKLQQAKLEQDKKDKLEKQKKELADKVKKEQADKLAKAKEEKQRKDDLKEAQQIEDQRNATIKRNSGLAGPSGNGAATSTGTAAQSASASASYAGRIVARIKPNITYLDRDNITGNPRTEVEIRIGPSGTILSARITQSSGLKSWDEAVLRGIEKTEALPRDVDGSVQPLILIGFKPKD